MHPMTRLLPLVALLAATTLVGCRTPGPATRLDAELGARIDALFEDVDADAPGLAVMVVRDGVVVHARGYGLADLETRQPIERTTPFRLASVTKQFTCMAILQLAEDGLLSIDDPALKYVPSLERFGPGVTIRHLMQHTSGLPEYYAELERLKYELPSADADPLLTAVDATLLYETWGEPEFAPGDRFSYSNPGYEQLGLIVEAVSGQSFGGFLRDAVLRPAGMRASVVRDRPEVEIPGRAIGYRRGRDGELTELDDHPGNWITGAGGLYASLDDLYFWDRALSRNTLVSPEWQALAFEPVTLNDGSLSNYGFGWGVRDHGGRRVVAHGGGWVGFRTHIERFLDEGVTVVVLSNLASTNPGALSAQVTELVFAEPGE